MREIKFLTVFIIVMLVFGTVAVAGLNHKISNFQIKTVEERSNDDFYFVQLTDTHIISNMFDKFGSTKKRLTTVLNKILSFENKPAFIAITGDLCEWSGSDYYGSLNCKTFVECFHENNNQLYADPEFTIPVYTTPGNHDYVYTRSLDNYHTYIDKNHIEEEDRYIITHGDVSLFFMDSGPNYVENPDDWLEILGDGLYEDDIEWLEEELSQCVSSHKIILMHHPAVSDRNEQGEMRDVIARNREVFIELCETNDVELVLTGHTHSARVYDAEENRYSELPLNCSQYPPLYVQSDDCKEGVHYRNISIRGDDVFLEPSVEVEFEHIRGKVIGNRAVWLIRNLISRFFS